MDLLWLTAQIGCENIDQGLHTLYICKDSHSRHRFAESKSFRLRLLLMTYQLFKNQIVIIVAVFRQSV